MRIRNSVLAVSLMFFLVSVCSAYGTEKVKTENIVDKAALVVKAFGADPDLEWFRNNVKNAKALLIVPQSLKGAFLVGGSGGSGVLIAQDSKTGEWGYPAFYTLGSISVGLQIGAESSEVILMIMSERGMEKLLTSSMKLGADVTLAVGPAGGGIAAQTADVLSYTRSKGVFAGVSLDGAIVRTRDTRNKEYYGSDVSPADILIRKTVSNSHADGLRKAVTVLTR
jgi:SH3 domain-containing YSC84-like protein 1